MKINFKKPVLECLETRLNPSCVGLLDAPAPLAGKPEAITLVDSNLIDLIPKEELLGSRVIRIEGSSDVISQVSEVLRSSINISTLRIISHGSSGEVWFGRQKIDSEVLSTRSNEIGSWAGSLAPGADILLYGCSIAGSQAGISFVNRLAALTGADIAASDDMTGPKGDLILEFTTGNVTHSLLADQTDWKERGVDLPVEGDFYYSVQNGLATLTGYTGAGGIITLPATIGGNPDTGGALKKPACFHGSEKAWYCWQLEHSS